MDSDLKKFTEVLDKANIKYSEVRLSNSIELEVFNYGDYDSLVVFFDKEGNILD